MAKYLVKIEREVEAVQSNEAAVKFKRFLVKAARENPDQLLITVNRVKGDPRNREPKLPKGTVS
ncbi:MAG: hypothetical protein ABSC48_10740 [Terracidiphilus sp.]